MMRARSLLRALLALQAVAVGAVAATVHGRCGWSWGAALAAALALLVLVRALICTNNFLLSASSASVTPPAARPGVAGWLGLWGREFVASLLQSSWHGARGAPFERIVEDGAGVPVLLLHGYGCNSGYWQQLSTRLAAQRINHASIDLAPLGAPIDDYCEQVERAVDALCAATGASAVAIVAHSMGGLVARAWLRRYGSTRLLRLITLGSPHHGTTLANFGIGANAAQMRRSRSGRQSDWLARLDADELQAGGASRALITSLYSYQDNIVSPQESSCLSGARLLPMGGVGHVALGRDARVLAAVLAELAALPRAGDTRWRGQGRRLAGKLTP